jgi:CDP-diacylglycerol--glycerol-3-phosphate 3-phosphatidyltransferase
MLRQIPNALTGIRLALSPIAAWAFHQALTSGLPTGALGAGPLGLSWTILGAGLFAFAALTDLFDGMAARALNAHSKFGRLIDPIADKALVGLPLIASSHALLLREGQNLLSLCVAACTLIIVTRDIAMTLARLTARDGEGARVSRLAKIKTALELVAIGAPVALAGMLPPDETSPAWVLLPWLTLLPIAAALSLWTALAYARR